jgi:chromosomal replication initiation ATPase DnaA
MDKGMITERGRKGNEGRKLALYLAKRYSGLSNGEIGMLFGGIQSSGVTKASGRVEEKMKRDARIRRLVDSIMSKVKA